MQLPRPMPLALIALAVALLAGCGGEESTSTEASDEEQALEAYSADMDVELRIFTIKLTALGMQADKASSAADFRSSLAGVEDRVGKTIASLEAIEPPPRLADIHAQLIDAFEEFKTSYVSIADAVNGGDEQEIQQAVLGLQQATADFSAEFDDLSAQAERLGAPITGRTSPIAP